MNTGNNKYYVKLIHCGNKSIANDRDQEEKNIFFIPMGLFPLAGILEKEVMGVDVEIIHLDLEGNKSIEEIIEMENLDAVGFDCHWVNQGLVVMETAELIKAIKPEVFIFLGGFTASLFAGEIVRDFSQVDAVIRGDAEIPIVELCKVLQESKKDSSDQRLDKVQNLVWRKKMNDVQFNEFTYVGTVEIMEKLDFVAVNSLRNRDVYKETCKYFSHFEPFGKVPVFFLQVGRGCSYACLYCGGNCEAQKRMNNRKNTVMRSVESVIETINKAVFFGFQTFYTCMEFEGSDEWYIRLLRRIKAENIKINFCYGSWRLPSKTLIDALSESCNHALVEISPETSSYGLRKRNKDSRLCYTDDRLEQCLDYINKKKNVKVQLYFGYYLSGDTKGTIMDTIRFIATLILKYPDLVEAEYSNFSTDPGSLFFFHPETYEIDIKVRHFKDFIKYAQENYVEREKQQADMTLFKPRHLTHREDIEIRGKIRRLNHLFSVYRKTVTHILKRTGTPESIISLLNEQGSDIKAERFPPGEIKGWLLRCCEKYNILDEFLIGLIGWECEKARSCPLTSRPTPQLYMDLEIEDNILTDDIVESMIRFIDLKSNNKGINENLDIDFDLKGD